MVVETAPFIAAARSARLSDDEINRIIDHLAGRPDAGDPIQGTGGARKVRFAGRGKGKSGGYRVITFYSGGDLPVFLLTVFAKGERADLSKAERNALARLDKGAGRQLSFRLQKPGNAMSKKAFDKIKAGLEDAIAIARGEADPATYRIHVPDEVDVKAIRRKLGMSQAQFAASFGFGLDAVQNWEQGRRRPEGAARAFLKVIEREPDAVRRALAA